MARKILECSYIVDEQNDSSIKTLVGHLNGGYEILHLSTAPVGVGEKGSKITSLLTAILVKYEQEAPDADL